jgi:hypothetical protein
MLFWHGLELRRGHKRGRLLATLYPDADFPFMWRIRMRDGEVSSDMLNLPRAKQLAMDWARDDLEAVGQLAA